MILLIQTQHRGAVPRKLKRVTRQATAAGLREATEYFHDELRDRRFTRSHASAAGYQTRGRAYTRRKQKIHKHKRPLEFTGKTRDRIEQPGGYRFVSTSKSARVTYAGARRFNLRNPHSAIRMREEFERILPEEERQFALIVDQRLDEELGRVD